MAEEVIPRWGLSEVNFIETAPEAIKAEIITGYEMASGRTLADGDPVRLFLLSIADRIIQLKSNINIAAQQNLLSYAQGDNLDALGFYMSTERLGASHAVATFQFKLSQAQTSAYSIPAGTEITNGNITFATNEELLISAGELTGEVSASCLQAGAVGNGYLAGQINTIVEPMTFLESAENITTSSGGADSENDAEYAERIRLAPNSFSIAGPKKAYEYHAQSVSSTIIDVSVDSPKAGEVKVYPLLAGGELPSSDILQQVQEYLSSEDIRPLTDEVETLSPSPVEYNIVIDYYISKSDVALAESIKSSVEESVEKYRIWQQTKIGRDITPTRLIAFVMASGATSIDLETLSPASTISLDAFQVAQCKSVKVNFKGYKDE